MWKKIVHFILNLDDKDAKSAIDFFGGEPLMFPNLFIKSVEYLLDQGYNGAIRVTTNGTTMNKELRDFIKKHGIYVVFSFDGLDQAKNRGKIDENKLNLLRDVVTHINYVVADPTRFLDNIVYIWKKGFNIVNDIDLMGRNVSLTDKDYQAYAKQYEKIIKLMIEMYFNKNTVLAIKSAFSDGSLNLKCGWATNALGIYTDGKVYPCHRGPEVGDIFCVGDVEKGIDTQKLNKLRKLSDGYCVIRTYQERGVVGDIVPRHIKKLRQIRKEIIDKYRKELKIIKERLYGNN